MSFSSNVPNIDTEKELGLGLYACNHGIPAKEVAPVVGIDEDAVERVFRDIDNKRRTTLYGHLPPLHVEKIELIKSATCSVLADRQQGWRRSQ
jgi:hypothetical protein